MSGQEGGRNGHARGTSTCVGMAMPVEKGGWGDQTRQKFYSSVLYMYSVHFTHLTVLTILSECYNIIIIILNSLCYSRVIKL